MRGSQADLQTLCWSSNTKKRPETPQYHLLYSQKTVVVMQRDRSEVLHDTEYVRSVTAKRNTASSDGRDMRYKSGVRMSSSNASAKKRDEDAHSHALAHEKLTLRMDNTDMHMPFNNSLYPHLKAKTAASIKPSARRSPDWPDQGVTVLRRVPAIDSPSRAPKREPSYCNGFINEFAVAESSTGLQRASVKNSTKADGGTSKPAPFIIRQKLAKQYRELTRLHGAKYDGSTLMGFGSDHLKKVIDNIGIPGDLTADSMKLVTYQRQSMSLQSPKTSTSRSLDNFNQTSLSLRTNGVKQDREASLSFVDDASSTEADD